MNKEIINKLERPTDKVLEFLGEENNRWESYEYYEDEDGNIWIRWDTVNYLGDEPIVEWFKEGFSTKMLKNIDWSEVDWETFDQSEYYDGHADKNQLETIKDKMDTVKELFRQTGFTIKREG